MHVLIAAREARVRRIVYASCGSVYGAAASQPVSEDAPPAPDSDFAKAKDIGEKDCLAFNYLYGLETVRLRLFNVFGPRQRPGSPHARFVVDALQAALAGRNPEIPGDGHSRMDLLFVGDAVQAFLLAARTSRAAGKVYNIGYGQPTTPLKILDALNRILAGSIHPSFSTPKPPTEFDNLPDIRRAEAELGFCPAIRLEAGLRQTIDYCLQQPAAPVDLGEPGTAQPAPGEKKIPSP